MARTRTTRLRGVEECEWGKGETCSWLPVLSSIHKVVDLAAKAIHTTLSRTLTHTPQLRSSQFSVQSRHSGRQPVKFTLRVQGEATTVCVPPCLVRQHALFPARLSTLSSGPSVIVSLAASSSAASSTCCAVLNRHRHRLLCFLFDFFSVSSRALSPFAWAQSL